MWTWVRCRGLLTAVQVRQRLINTRRRMEDLLAGNQPSSSDECFQSTDELAAPLLACYWSLWDCGVRRARQPLSWH